MTPHHYCCAEGGGSFRIISIDDMRRIIPLLSLVLMSEDECVTCVYGHTVWPRCALLSPTLSPVEGEVLEPFESLSRQVRLSIRSPEPRMLFLAGWGFTLRDREIICKQIEKNK